MKPLILLFGGLLLWTSTAFAAGTHYRVMVDGLACPFCAYGIEKKLSQLEGVDQLHTDIKKGEVTITMKDGKTLTAEAVGEAVKTAGFKLHSLETVAEDKP